jgi:outer membrane protein OmpA-like peptidoglycan-associated protein
MTDASRTSDAPAAKSKAHRDLVRNNDRVPLHAPNQGKVDGGQVKDNRQTNQKSDTIASTIKHKQDGGGKQIDLLKGARSLNIDKSGRVFNLAQGANAASMTDGRIFNFGGGADQAKHSDRHKVNKIYDAMRHGKDKQRSADGDASRMNLTLKDVRDAREKVVNDGKAGKIDLRENTGERLKLKSSLTTSDRTDQTTDRKPVSGRRANDANRQSDSKDTKPAKSHPDEGDKTHDKRSDRAASSTDGSGIKTDRDRSLIDPKDGIGFSEGSDKFDRAKLRPFVTDQVIKDVNAGDASIYLHARASRSGSSDANKDLTDRRGMNAKDALVRMGVDPNRILIDSTGEDDAKQQNKPDGKDDPTDRNLIIEVHKDKGDSPILTDTPQVQGDYAQASKSLEAALPTFNLDKNASEVFDIVKKNALSELKGLAKDTLKDPALFEELAAKHGIEFAAKVGKDGAVWMVTKLALDLDPKGKEHQAYLVANALGGMQDALCEFGGVPPRTQPHNYFRGEKSPLYRFAKGTYLDNLYRLPAAEQTNLKNVIRSGKGNELYGKLQSDLTRYTSRGVVNW